MVTLVGIAYSPWTHRARMALDRQRVPYAFRPFTTMVSEPRLRFELGDLGRPVSVPVLLRTDGPPLRDSFDIACWAAERAERPLVTAENREAVVRWNSVADAILSAGRVRTTYRVLANPEALRDSLPGPMGRLGPMSDAIGRMGARHLLGRYADPAKSEHACLQAMVEGLDAVRAALAGGDALLGERSYADLTCAAALAFVRPHAKAPIGPVARRCWTEPDLADAYADLLAWRDAIHAGR